MNQREREPEDEFHEDVDDDMEALPFQPAEEQDDPNAEDDYEATDAQD